MKQFVVRRLSCLMLVAWFVGATGCNARKPLEIDPGLASAGFETIALMPVIDARPTPDRFDYVILSRDVTEATARYLREKGYLVAQPDSYAQRQPDAIDIDSVQAADLVPLVREDAHHFLIVQIERMDRTVDEAGVLYYVRLSAVLVDRDARRVLWRDVGSASNTLTGVFTVMMHGSGQFEAAYNAARSLYSTLPARTVPKATKKKR